MESLDEWDDEALMAEVAAGNRLGLDVLARRHLPRGIALARRIVGNVHDAEDVMQECFLQVWRHASAWRGEGARFTTWFYRIVVNRSISRCRGRAATAPLEEACEVPCPQPDAAVQAEVQELAVRVDEAIAALPERQRAALGLCYYQGLSCAEAASVLQVSVSAAESLLVRARRVLRERMKEWSGTS